MFVIDASVAAKWVIEEPGTPESMVLREQAKLMAPDLLMAECANILWKKVRRHELTRGEAILAARLLQGAEVELLPTRSLLQLATKIAINLDHPAYDCLYLALALENDCKFVTADERFLRTLGHSRGGHYRGAAISLSEAAASVRSLLPARPP